MVGWLPRVPLPCVHLSVLALSSRFDGPRVRELPHVVPMLFQYSLCRVVLMVPAHYSSPARVTAFSTRSVESF